jgi:hypothetical protein
MVTDEYVLALNQVLFSKTTRVILVTNVTSMQYNNTQLKFASKWVSVLMAALLISLPAVTLAIARGYKSDDTGLQTGMTVALSVDSSDDSKVERADQNSSDRVVGVVTTIDSSLITVSSGSAKVLVESEGQTDVYVSDINGLVNQGDTLVLSPLKGILMKSQGNVAATIIAIAASSSTETSTYSYEDNGEQKETQISKIAANLNHLGGDSGAAQNDSALAKLGRSVVGKDVGELRVLIAMIIFVIVLIAEGGIIYGGISSAITALGRNPLARKIIRAELLRVVGIAIIVLFVGLGAVYAILWI